MQSAREFLSGIIDYAGLFPPASLSMREAVSAYSDFTNGPQRDLLGRFIVPAAKLDELDDVAKDFLPRERASDPWRLSVIAGDHWTTVRESSLKFNCSHWEDSDRGHAVCDAIELRVDDPRQVERALTEFPPFFQLFLEVPSSRDPEPLIAAIAGTRAAAKIRTGGVTPDAIPNSADILRFLRVCLEHHVSFKATAGLHHAVRANYPLTYAPDAPRAEMHGFLNVFLAAAALESGASEGSALAILEERDPTAFRFHDGGASWRNLEMSTDHLIGTRRHFALSYGSCSFTEPVSEAAQLGLI